ncbi:hypothetical protein Tco_1280777 [Tanacetum coccineum]
MLDAFTSFMCVEAWGRIGYARALIEVGADNELKQEVIMAILNVDDEDVTHTLEKIKVEYKWKPPLCVDCQVFGHTTEQCPKCVLEKPSPIMETDDGFIYVNKIKSKGKSLNQKGNFNESSNGVKVQNHFEKLNEITSIVDPSDGKGKEVTIGESNVQNASTGDDFDSEIEEVFTKENPYMSKPKGARTPYE